MSSKTVPMCYVTNEPKTSVIQKEINYAIPDERMLKRCREERSCNMHYNEPKIVRKSVSFGVLGGDSKQPGRLVSIGNNLFKSFVPCSLYRAAM